MIKMRRLADDRFEFKNSNTGRVILVNKISTYYDALDENGYHKFDQSGIGKFNFMMYIEYFAIGNEKAIEHILKDLNYVF